MRFSAIQLIGPASFGDSGLLCILRNRKDALLALIIRMVTSSVAVDELGVGVFGFVPGP